MDLTLFLFFALLFLFLFFSHLEHRQRSVIAILAIDTPTIKSRIYWRYLGLSFDWHLSFKKYIYYYSTKVLSTMKVIGMFGNLTRDLLSLQKWLLLNVFGMMSHIWHYCFRIISSVNKSAPNTRNFL